MLAVNSKNFIQALLPNYFTVTVIYMLALAKLKLLFLKEQKCKCLFLSSAFISSSNC